MHADNSRSESVVVCNLSAPEVNRLGVELARRRVLHKYVRPYANMQRWWERAVSRAPGIGKLYGRTLGRRLPPAGLPPELVVQAGVGGRFRRGTARPRARGHRAVPAQGARADLWRRARGRPQGGKLAREASIVVASYGTGRYAFETVQRAGGRAVLNYPIAHNRFQTKFYAEEAEHAPEFAAALPRMEWLPQEYSDRLDQECEMADRILVGSEFRAPFVRRAGL